MHGVCRLTLCGLIRENVPQSVNGEMKYIASEIGKRIREARRKRSMTQSELCGGKITRNLLSLIESGKSSPSIDTLCYIADRLDLPVGYFFYDTEREDSRFACFFASDEIRNLFTAKKYADVIRTSEQIVEYSRDDEVSMMLAVSYYYAAIEAADSDNFSTSRYYISEAVKTALKCVYLGDDFLNASEYQLKLIDFIGADSMPPEICSISSISSYISAETVFYFRMLSDDSFDFDSFSFTDGHLMLHSEAIRLMRAGMYDEAFAILIPLSREGTLPFYMKYRLFSSIELCAGVVGEFEAAYDASRMKLDLIKAAEEQ